MPNKHRDGELSGEEKLKALSQRYFQALTEALKGGQDQPLITGCNVSITGTGILVCVRATTLPDFKRVVAFGGGDTLFDALRNVSIAIGKGQWRADRYANTK